MLELAAWRLRADFRCQQQFCHCCRAARRPRARQNWRPFWRNGAGKRRRRISSRLIQFILLPCLSRPRLRLLSSPNYLASSLVQPPSSSSLAVQLIGFPFGRAVDGRRRRLTAAVGGRQLSDNSDFRLGQRRNSRRSIWMNRMWPPRRARKRSRDDCGALMNARPRR